MSANRTRQDDDRDFASKKFRWLERVARDARNLPPLAPAVCIEFCHYFGEDGNAWPAQDTLAKTFGVKRQTINLVLAALVERNHLISIRQGRGRTNLYRMVDEGDDEQSRCPQTRTSSDDDVSKRVHQKPDDVRKHGLLDVRKRGLLDVRKRGHESHLKKPPIGNQEESPPTPSRGRYRRPPGDDERGKKTEDSTREETRHRRQWLRSVLGRLSAEGP